MGFIGIIIAILCFVIAFFIGGLAPLSLMDENKGTMGCFYILAIASVFFFFAVLLTRCTL